MIDADLTSLKAFVMYVDNLGDIFTIKMLNIIIKGLQILDVNPIIFQNQMHGAIYAIENKLIFVK